MMSAIHPLFIDDEGLPNGHADQRLGLRSGEAAIQAGLYKLMEGKTVVAIAHLLSTFAAVNRLIVPDQGRVGDQHEIIG